MATSEPDPKSLYANLVERVTCAILDLALVAWLIILIDRFTPTGFPSSLVLIAIFLLYFAAAWSGPWRATPIQLLFRLRVVDVRGDSLDFRRAALRAALVIGIFVGCASIVAAPRNALLGIVFLISTGFLLLAAITARRQAAHDLVVGSVVVRARALKDPNLRALLEHSVDAPIGQTGWLRKLRPGEIIQAIILIGGGAFMTYSYAEISYMRELRARTAYAIGHAGSLKAPIKAFYAEHGRWPGDAVELGLGGRTRFPDGGYYELESAGVIRIRFEKLTELVNGSLTLVPLVQGRELEWTCRAHGAIQPADLPALCRD